MSAPKNDFIGPCAHGRDPYSRCEECQDMEPWQAEIVALRAQLAIAEGSLDAVKPDLAEAIGWPHGQEDAVHQKLRTLLDYAATERAKVTKLREALRKCAEPSRWHAPCVSCGPSIVEAGCYIARAALRDSEPRPRDSGDGTGEG